MQTNVEEFLGELGAGAFVQKLAHILSESAQSQLLHGVGNKKSKLVIEFSFQQMGENEQVIISHKINSSLPTRRGKKSEEDTTETVFFVGKGGVMTINPPREEDNNDQFQLRDINQSTGEIKHEHG